jgi:hypothetical protein
MNDGSEVASALRVFRERFYGCLRQRADALFELTDSLLTAGTVSSPVHLSLELVHRRGWGSCTETPRSISWEAQRKSLRTNQTLPGDQEGRIDGINSQLHGKLQARHSVTLC